MLRWWLLRGFGAVSSCFRVLIVGMFYSVVARIIGMCLRVVGLDFCFAGWVCWGCCMVLLLGWVLR